MKKLLVAALIVPVVLLGAARPAKAGNEIGAVLTGIAVGIGAALVIDALTPPRVVAAPPVVYAPAPVVVHTPPPVVYRPAPVIIHTPPPVVYRPAPVVVYTPPPVIVRPAPVVYRPAPVVVHHDGHRGKGHWKHASRHHD